MCCVATQEKTVFVGKAHENKKQKTKLKYAYLCFKFSKVYQDMSKCVHKLLKKSVKYERMFIIEKLATGDKPKKACSCGENDEKYNNLTYALFIACYKGNLGVAKKILEINKKILVIYGDPSKTKKARVNRHDININAMFSAYTGRGCIHEAASQSIDLVNLLVQNGADINLKNDNGNNPLMSALYYECSIDIIKFLVENVANLNLKNNAGKTALYIAVKKENFDAIEILMKSGADYTIQNKKNKSPLDIAIDFADDPAGYYGTSGPDDAALRVLLKYCSNLPELKKIVETKTNRYKNSKNFRNLFGMCGIKSKNLILVLSYCHDNDSLLNDSYLPKDLFVNIIQEANMQYYCEKYNVV